MRKPTKTYPAIRWADGRTAPIFRTGSRWWFRVPNGGECSSDSLWNLTYMVEDLGGTVVRTPNTRYAEQLRAYEARQLRRMFRGLVTA